MRVLFSFGKGMIALGVALLLPNLNTLFGDFTQFSQTQLILPIFGFMLISLYYFIEPAT